MFFKKKKRNLIDDLELASKWVAKALNSSNYQADYSVESLKEIDRFFKEENRPDGILSKNVGQILFSLGAYVGDVFIKEFGGKWVTDDGKDAEINVQVVLDNGISFLPCEAESGRSIPTSPCFPTGPRPQNVGYNHIHGSS